MLVAWLVCEECKARTRLDIPIEEVKLPEKCEHCGSEKVKAVEVPENVVNLDGEWFDPSL